MHADLMLMQLHYPCSINAARGTHSQQQQQQQQEHKRV